MALFVAALAIWFVVKVHDVLLLVFIAVLLAFYLSSITDLLERRFRTPRWMGLTAAVVATTAALAGLGALLVPPVIDQTQALIGGLPQTLTDIQRVLASWASQYPVLRASALADPQSGLVAGLVNDAATFLRGSALPYVTAGGKLRVSDPGLATQPTPAGPCAQLPPSRHDCDREGGSLVAYVTANDLGSGRGRLWAQRSTGTSTSEPYSVHEPS